MNNEVVQVLKGLGIMTAAIFILSTGVNMLKLESYPLMVFLILGSTVIGAILGIKSLMEGNK